MKIEDSEFDDLLRELMDAYMEIEGARLNEENERLKQDPSAALPEDLEKRMLEFLERQFEERRTTPGGNRTDTVL